MAQRVDIKLIDDLDGTTEGAETVTFALDGHDYEIELCEANNAKLRKALGPFIEHARPVKHTRASARPRPTRGPSRARSGVVRAWAKDQGISLNARGRVPAEVIAKWESAGRPGA